TSQAFLVRKDGDAGDIFYIDTISEKAKVNGLIDFDHSFTDNSSAQNAWDFGLNVYTTSDNNQSHRGYVSNVVYLGSNTLTLATGGGIIAGINQAGNGGTGTITEAIAFNANAHNYGGGTITDGIGVNLSHVNLAGGTYTRYTGIQFQGDGYGGGLVPASTVYAFNFEGDTFMSNDRSVSVAHSHTQRYMPLSYTDTGITFNATDLIFATQSSGDIGLYPASNVVKVGGDVYVTSSSYGLILTSPDGTCARGTIDDSDVLTFASITCP
ncbi:MAG: hypothetical protein ABII02_01065, partial [Candidatus Magasanikbacteria bacterium]